MRLLFLNYEFPPVGGGAAYASFAMARELVSFGHSVDFLTTSTRAHTVDAEIGGVRVFRARSLRWGVHESGLMGAFSFLCFAACRLRTIARNTHYDAYHYYFSLPTGVLTRIPGPHQSRPYVVSLRGSDVPGYEPELASYHRSLLPVTRRIWKGAHRVVANSHDLRRLALASVPDVPIEVISNGVYSPARIPLTDAHEDVRILAVSRLIARKGLDTLIMALAKCSDQKLSLDIAGEGPDAAALKQLAGARGLSERVRFHGFVDREGLAALYAKSHIFVLTSLAESCSMALLEAMAAGLPLIATNVGGNVELVQNGFNGLLVPPKDVDALAAALSGLGSDAEQRARFAATNRKLARERFSWSTMARKYEAVFQQAMEEHDAISWRAPVAQSDRLE